MKFTVATSAEERRNLLYNYVDSPVDDSSPSVAALRTLIVEYYSYNRAYAGADSLHSRIHNALNTQRTSVALHIERKEEIRNRYEQHSIAYANLNSEVAYLQFTLDVLNALSEGKTVPMS